MIPPCHLATRRALTLRLPSQGRVSRGILLQWPSALPEPDRARNLAALAGEFPRDAATAVMWRYRCSAMRDRSAAPQGNSCRPSGGPAESSAVVCVSKPDSTCHGWVSGRTFGSVGPLRHSRTPARIASTAMAGRGEQFVSTGSHSRLSVETNQPLENT